jgi:hypothetical protein
MKSLITFLSLVTISSTNSAQAESKIVRGIQVPVVISKVEVPESYNPKLVPEKQVDSLRGYLKLVQLQTLIQKEKVLRDQGQQGNTEIGRLTESAFKDLEQTVEHDVQAIQKKGTPATVVSAANLDPGTRYSDEAKFKRGYFFTQFPMEVTAAAQSPAELCQNFRDNRQKAILDDTINHLSLTNDGGAFGAGVCWWHSSLTRAAAYLVIFKVNAAKPTSVEARSIIQRLGKMDQVVIIPGFSNLNEFSEAYPGLVLKELESMQTSDILSFDTRGFSGSASNDAVAMKQQMDRAYTDSAVLKQPVYLMLQKPGVEAHSWIVSDMQKTKDGYLLFVLDSNHLGLHVWKYINGMKEFIDEHNVPFIPYVDSIEKAQLAMIKNVVSSYCKQNRL